MDRALEMAQNCHRTYLDADSADSGPIEDYIAAAIREAVTMCAEICETEGWEKPRSKASAATAIALAKRMRERFDLPPE